MTTVTIPPVIPLFTASQPPLFEDDVPDDDEVDATEPDDEDDDDDEDAAEDEDVDDNDEEDAVAEDDAEEFDEDAALLDVVSSFPSEHDASITLEIRNILPRMVRFA